MPHAEHGQAKGELKSLIPEYAKEAIGHGPRLRQFAAIHAVSIAEQKPPDDG